MAKKKPDQVADNPSTLPYASNVGAPSIKPSNLTSFKQEKLLKTNKYFSSRYEEIKEEYKKLIECTARMEISDDYGVDLEDLSLAYWDQDDEYVYDRDCTFPNKSGGYETLINYLAKPLRDNILLNHF